MAPNAHLPTAVHPGDWTAMWIEPVEPTDGPAVHRPAYHLATEFTVGGPVLAATLFATAHGLYEAFVNGTRVGDLELTPGFTAYRHRLQVHAFDVTALVHQGTNAVGALLSDGWWRGQHGVIREIDAYGTTTAFLAELHIDLASGGRVVVGTDGTWWSTPSHVLATDLIAGEVHNLRRRVVGWATAGTDRTAWHRVRTADHGYDRLCTPVGPPIRRVQELPAVSVTEIAPGRHVVDFGQNSNGWIRLGTLGPEGTVLTIAHGEALDADGDVTLANIEHGAFAEQRDVPFQTDTVVSADDGSVFEPRHSTKGFRYVRIDGLPGGLHPSAVTSIVVHNDFDTLGSFHCSDERVNRLHEAAVWSFRGNACGLPTDCPTRERSGWVGDWQIYVDTAASLFDVTDFSVGWLRDLAADQLPDGRVTSIVPDPSPDAPVWRNMHGSSGWGDAAVHVPWALYRATGRTDFIADQLPSMCRWVDFAAGAAAEGRHPSRVERSTQPLPHEQYLWDSGWHFGEWLVPGDEMETIVRRLRREDHGIVATAFLYRSADELSQLAALAGDQAVAQHYGHLAANVLAAWRTEFVVDGRVASDRQADLVRALAFGLVPDELRATTADQLVALIRAADGHLGTGFLATPFLLPVLADHGHLDVAYELLFQPTEPSWMFMIDRGATTIWEDWDGIRADGSAKHSLNHYSKGAVISFLHRYVAGLQLVEPAYRRVCIAPRPGHGITQARTHHDAPHGRIEVAWRITDGLGSLAAIVPDGTTADIVLPDGRHQQVGAGRHEFSWAAAG